MKTQNQKSSRFAGLTESELAKLIQQYGCGPVRFSGTDEALYERHLVFDNVMEMAAIGARERFEAIAHSVRDVLSQRWIHTEKTYERQNAKRVYYLSMEFLIGRSLANNVTNLLLDPVAKAAIKEKDLDWFELLEQEPDAGLGNGGLGRLAACFLDSMATMQIPATGYGLRYEYGMFKQSIQDGWQHELPDNWLRRPTRGKSRVRTKPWMSILTARSKCAAALCIQSWVVHHGSSVFHSIVQSSATAARTSIRCVSGPRQRRITSTSRNSAAVISSGLWRKPSGPNRLHGCSIPTITQPWGRGCVSCRNIFSWPARSLISCAVFAWPTPTGTHSPDKVAIQLNDTHPTMAVPELMRILLDEVHLGWDDAWTITVKTLAYTNHTLLPEALEKWPVEWFQILLPRHLEIIYEINRRLLDDVRARFPGDEGRVQRVTLIEEGAERKVRMANLAIAGSHSTNGVAAIHSHLLRTATVRDLAEMFPERFNNKTNGVTPRRWLLMSNPGLSRTITDAIGDGWIKDLSKLKQLKAVADDRSFHDAFLKANAKPNRSSSTGLTAPPAKR